MVKESQQSLPLYTYQGKHSNMGGISAWKSPLEIPCPRFLLDAVNIPSAWCMLEFQIPRRKAGIQYKLYCCSDSLDTMSHTYQFGVTSVGNCIAVQFLHVSQGPIPQADLSKNSPLYCVNSFFVQSTPLAIGYCVFTVKLSSVGLCAAG